ncbi:MAG: tetratricopeptide repeat protein [Bacteroidetes bacterium]|nr:tetratricopeptide repeat protein [Bacteroidota bacterium]
MTNQDIEERLTNAITCSNVGRFEEAKQLIKMVLTLNDLNISHKTEAMLTLAELASRQSKNDEAFSIAEEALSLAIENNLSQSQSRALKIIGIIHYSLGSYDKSLEYFGKVININEESGDNSVTAQVLGNIGSVYLSLGLLEKALEYYGKALSLHYKHGDKINIAIITANIGNVYASYGWLDKALEYYNQSLKLHQEQDNKQSIAQVIGNLGLVYRILGDFDKAFEFFTQSVMLQQELGVKIGVAIFLGNLGLLHTDFCSYQKALEYNLQSINVYEQIGNKHGIATIIGNNGNIYYKLGEYRKALSQMLKSLAIHRELGNLRGASEVIGNMGTIYADKNYEDYDFNMAEKYLLEAISQSETLGLMNHLQSLYETISTLYENENNLEKFAYYFRKHHELYIEFQNEEVKKQADKFGWERKIADMEKQKEIELLKTEAEKVNLQIKIESQTRELDTSLQEIIKKNNLLQLVQSSIKKIRPFTRGEGIQYVEQLHDRVTRSIAKLETISELDKQWADVHGTFMKKLQDSFPELTTMELKIAALIRMKLSSSNMASVLFLSQRTVESHRHSLRKKMGISSSDNIYSILSKYSES